MIADLMQRVDVGSGSWGLSGVYCKRAAPCAMALDGAGCGNRPAIFFKELP